MLRTFWLLALAAAVAYLAYLASSFVTWGNADPRRPEPPGHIELVRRMHDTNVLFILIDTLRADRLSAYGYERETSPALDYMASTGVRFARHLSQSSWTKCSMASLWTGLYPIRTGVLRAENGTPEEATMPAEILSEADFRTAGIWRNGWVAPNFGFGQGFEVYKRPRAQRPPASVQVQNPHISLAGTDYDTLESAQEFLRIYGRKRWFLYVHLMDVHQYLYDESTALFGNSYSDMYDNSIRHEDVVVGQLLTYLVEMGLLDKTIVIIASDHGEAFSERGLEGHARHVYRESTEVPLIISFPFKLEPGIVVDSRSRNVDLWPTILDLLGLPALPDTDGKSLVPQIMAAAQGEDLDDDRPAFAHLEQGWGQIGRATTPLLAVARGDKRLVVDYRPAENAEELFDRSVDPRELTNMLAEQPDAADALRALAEEYFESPPAPWGAEATLMEIDEMQMNQLRALGYRSD
jgi:arylsulfatase A-like enzyme